MTEKFPLTTPEGKAFSFLLSLSLSLFILLRAMQFDSRDYLRMPLRDDARIAQIAEIVWSFFLSLG